MIGMNQKHRTLKPCRASKHSSIPALPLTGDGLIGSKGGKGAVSILGQGGTNASVFGEVPRQSGRQSVVMGDIQRTQALNSNEKMMMKRIRELETQNERLKKHVGQAEDAIRNYRGFLTARGTSAVDADSDSAKSNEKACQTVETHNVIDALQAELNSTRRKLVVAEKEQERKQQKNAAASTALWSTDRISDKQTRGQSSKELSCDTTSKTNSIDDAAALKSDLSMWKSRCTSAEQQSKQMRFDYITERKKNNSLNAIIKQVRFAFAEFKLQFQVERNELLDDVRQNNDTAKEFCARLQEMSTCMETRSDEVEVLRRSLNLRDSQLSAAEQALGQARIDTQHWRDKYAELDESIQAKTDSATATAQQVASVLAAAMERSKKEKEEVHVKGKMRDLEDRVDLLSLEREKYFLRFSGMQGQLRAIKKQVKALQEAHEDEIKAVKHSAHVKDLGRIAFTRELSLERDKAVNDLKHAKEVESVLAFCVSTLEQNLLELQPQVVAKVAERRAKRLRQLEKMVKAASRDIDQRSTDVLAVSSAALEGFKAKAEKKLVAAVEVRERVAALLVDQVQIGGEEEGRNEGELEGTT